MGFEGGLNVLFPHHLGKMASNTMNVREGNFG